MKADGSLNTTKRSWESLLKLSLPTPAEGCEMEVFQNDAPDLFHKGGPFSPIGKHEPSSDQLLSFADWRNASGMGFGDTMKEMIPQVELAIQSYIDKHFGFGTDIHTMATHCLRNAMAWLLDLIKFIFNNQEAYTSSQFSAKSSEFLGMWQPSVWGFNTHLKSGILKVSGCNASGEPCGPPRYSQITACYSSKTTLPCCRNTSSSSRQSWDWNQFKN
jgi:hypothetical protein